MAKRPRNDDATPLGERIEPSPTDRIGTKPLHSMRHAGPRLGVSIPGAVGGALLVCAIAFGANLGLAGATRDDDSAGSATAVVDRAADRGLALVDEQGNPVDEPPAGEPEEPATGPDEDTEPTPPTEPEQEPTPAPDKEPDTEPTPKPDKEPTPKPDKEPTPKPEPAKLGLELAIKEGAVLIDWTTCEVDGADYYKVVRSTDSTVKWPTGDNDELIAAVEIGGKTKAWDEHAPADKKVWYRVFCVRHTEDGYKVLTSSAAESIRTPETEEPTPKPEPTAMWIEASVEGGAIVLHWEACGADGFSHYRILRKVDGDAAVIAEIEDAGTTTYVDDDVEPGVEYHYLVQSKGHIGDDWVLLGTTEWVGAVVE